MKKQMVIPVVFNHGDKLFLPEYRIIPGIRAEVALLTPEIINILRQVRRTFDEEEIAELANSIATHGLRTQPSIVLFDKEGGERYLDLVRRFWGDQTKLSELVAVDANGLFHYLVLADGERRTRAIRYLKTNGCDKCLEEAGGEPIGERCFLKHFPTGQVQYNLDRNSTPEDLFEAQMVGNKYVPPPIQEVVQGWQQYYKYLKEGNPKITFVEVARRLGTKEGSLRKALNVLALPPKILKRFESGETVQPYGIFVELTRLHNRGVSEERLEEWLANVARHGWKIADMRLKVSEYLASLGGAQTSMIDIMSEAATKSARANRQPIAKRTAEGLHGFMGYIEKLRAAAESGLIGAEDSPFSDVEAVNLLIALYQEGKKLPPHLRALKNKIEKQGLELVPEKVEKHGGKLQERLNTGG